MPVWAILTAFIFQFTSGSAQGAANQAASTNLSRKIHVVAKHTRGLRGMTAKSKVVISGTVSTDSYDSSDPAKSTGGSYDPAKAGEEGFVGTTSKVANDMEIAGDTQIVGPIATGAPGVLKPLGGNAVVGSQAFVDAGNDGRVEAGWHRDDLNVSFPDSILPNGAAIWPPPVLGIVNGTNYFYVLGNGNYSILNFILDSGKKAMITGKAVLYVRDTFAISGQSQLIIAPGGSLDLYVEKVTTISGGGVLNATGNAANFSYYGMKQNYQVNISGDAAFVGVIYAPYAKLDLTGTSAFLGAAVSNEIILGGTFAFHYDQALGARGLRYIPVTWKEL